jgi:radical SAM superfamily enzyme YgiQ (UPF0313 family)
MKILLVNPYIYDFTAYDLWLRPLGLLYIASVLKKFTNSTLYWLDTLDRFQKQANLANLPQYKSSKRDGRGKYTRILAKKPKIYEEVPRRYARYGIPISVVQEKIENLPEMDLILITSLMTYWVDGVRETLNILKKRYPKTKIVLGGILPSLISKDLLRASIDVDHYLTGYGERKVLKFITSMGSKIYAYPDLTHINNIPFPAYEFLSNKDALPLITSRGCPYNCSYCASNILNKKFLERSVENILQEINYLHETYKNKHFVIFDDAFLVNKKKRFFKVFSEVQKTLAVTFHTPNGLHAGEIDQKTAQVLYNSRFKNLRLSFESTSDKILSKSSNKITVKQMQQAVLNLEAAGYKRNEIGVYLLFGYPGQTLQDIKEALDFVKDLGVTPHLSYFSPVPGTRDFKRLQESGILSSPTNLYETNKIYFLYNKSNFSLEEIKYIKNYSSKITTELNSRN